MPLGIQFPLGNSQASGLGTGGAIPYSEKGAASGVATLTAGGVIPDAQLPPLAINDVFPVADQAARLALTAQVGDVAIQADNGLTYILRVAPATVDGNWTVLPIPIGVLQTGTSVTVANLTDSALTATYIPVAGVAGLLGNSNLSVDTSVTTCSVLNFGATVVDPTSINGDLWLNTNTWKYQSGGTVKTLAVNQGVVDASTAAAGIVGECLTANVTAQALGGTGAAGNIVTLNLTAGDWMVEGSATLFGGTTGFTAASLVRLSLSLTTATQNTDTFLVSSDSIQALVASGYKGMRAPKVHVSVNTTTPIYLVATASYVAGSPTAAAQIVATRIR